MSAGLDAGEAERAARRSLGNVALVGEDTRAVWTWSVLEDVLQDLRYAFRVLARERAFTATALLTIVVLIGGTTGLLGRPGAAGIPLRDRATDPVTFGVAVGVFLISAATASAIPALRTFRVDPATALRHE